MPSKKNKCEILQMIIIDGQNAFIPYNMYNLNDNIVRSAFCAQYNYDRSYKKGNCWWFHTRKNRPLRRI